MNATDFRIGNLAKFRISDDVSESWRASRVDLEDLEYLSSYPDNDNVLPIEITADTLRQFGFDYDEIMYWINAEGCDGEEFTLGLSKIINGWVVHFGHFGNEIIVFKYIHQLQNLFHALTGSDLASEVKDM